MRLQGRGPVGRSPGRAGRDKPPTRGGPSRRQVHSETRLNARSVGQQSGRRQRPSHDSISVLMVMRLFPGMMPIFDVPPRPPEGMPTLYKLIDGLVEAGHTVHFAGVVNPGIDAIPQCEANGRPFFVHGATYHVIRLPFSKKVASLRIVNPVHIVFLVYKYFWLLWELLALIRKCRPQVLYVGGPYHFFGGLYGWAFRLTTVLRFYGTHDLWELRKSRLSYFRDPWAMLAFRTPFDFAVITNDGTFGDRVARSFHVPDDKVGFWINGVDKDAYDSCFDRTSFLQSAGIAGEPKIVVSVDRLQDWKRQDRIIRSMPQVLERVPNALLLLVGDGPERRKLEELALSLEVQEHVRFPGSVPHSAVYGFIHSAHVYVSVHDLANMPVGLWEGMVCGRAVVTLNGGAFDGLATNDQELVLLKPDEVDARLGPILAELLHDEPRRARLGAAARAFALTKLDTWESRIAREVAVLEALARGEKPAW